MQLRLAARIDIRPPRHYMAFEGAEPLPLAGIAMVKLR